MNKNTLGFLLFLFLYSVTSFPQVQFKTGKIRVDVGKYGLIRLYSAEGTDTLKQIYRLNVLAAVDTFKVYDYIQDAGIQDTVKSDTLKVYSDFTVYGAFNNSYSLLPPDILHKLSVYGWQNSSFLVVKNRFINRETSSISPFLGIEHIPQVDGVYGFDTVSFIKGKNIIDTYRGGSHIGLKILSAETSSLFSFNFYGNYPYDSSYFMWLSHGTIDTIFVANDSGAVTISSVPRVFLSSGDSVDLYYAVSFGLNREEMIANMDSAETKFGIISPVEDNYTSVPDEFVLEQNYPNPFNPSTSISFAIPSAVLVNLKIYNMLGEEVAEVVNKEMTAGNHIAVFNASGLASGIYFYSLTAGNIRLTKKMTLLK